MSYGQMFSEEYFAEMNRRKESERKLFIELRNGYFAERKHNRIVTLKVFAISFSIIISLLYLTTKIL